VTTQDLNSPPQSVTGKKRGAGRATMVVAVLALLLSIVSAVLSWRASSKAGSAADKIDVLAAAQAAASAPAQPVTQPATEQPGATDSTGTPTDTPTGSVPTLNAQTQYKFKYTDETLKIPASCGSNVYIDLDEPRVQAESGLSELTYYDACSTSTATFSLSDGVEGSEVQSASVTPIECANQIRTSPLAKDRQPIRRGQVYCIKTSLDAARNSAISWKMVIISVSATAQDHTVTLKASAWDIPN
jgi:hypothetical protein